MHGRTSRTFRYATALLGCTVLVAGCSNSSSGGADSPPTASTSSLTMNLSAPLTSYDPAKGHNEQDALVDWALYDPLIQLDSTGKLIPGLATSWTATSRSAKLMLRSGVTCSDGTPLTPGIVAASLTRFFNPKTAAPLRSLVVGPTNTVTVSADGSSVTITMAKPWSDLIPGLATPFTGIVCPAGLRNPAMLTTKSAGTGRWVSASQVTGSSYTFTSRTDYGWGAHYTGATDGVVPKLLILKVISDENTEANLMATGAMQIGTYTGDAWSRFKNAGNVRVHSLPLADTFLTFNEAKGHPTANQNVRLAIAQAIDRSALNKVQSYGSGQLIDNLGEPRFRCYDDTLGAVIPKHNVAAARKLLDGVSVRIVGTTETANRDAASYLLSTLQAAGAKAALQSLNNATYTSGIFSGSLDWDITIVSIGNPLLSLLYAGGYYSGPTPAEGGFNLGSVQNPTAEQHRDAAAATTGAASCAAISAFQRTLFSRVDVVPLASTQSHVVMVGGVSALYTGSYVLPATIRVKG